MFMIIFGSFTTLLWVLIGVNTLQQSVISPTSYVCSWIPLVFWLASSTIADIIIYIRKKKGAKQST